MTNSPVVVFGATCESGIELIRLLSAARIPVIAAVRATSDTSRLESFNVDLRVAAAQELEEVRAVFNGVPKGVSVVSFLGGGRRSGQPIDAVGNKNAIDAAVAAGADRFVFVTSIGAGESWEGASSRVKEFLGPVLKLKTEAEDYLKSTKLRWTIIRPGGLTIPAPTGSGILVEDPMTMGMVNRSDVGTLTFRALMNDATVGKAYAAVDRHQCQNVAGGSVEPAEI